MVLAYWSCNGYYGGSNWVYSKDYPTLRMPCPVQLCGILFRTTDFTNTYLAILDKAIYFTVFFPMQALTESCMS